MFQGMRYVYAVYKEKSFSKAAKKLFISQPSLSANIKREELSIGYPIFDRSTKPLGLTEPGERYIQTIEQILSAQNNFFEYLNDWGNLKTGHLILGSSSLYSSWTLPPMMGEFTKKYPHIRLELFEENTATLERMLKNGEIDLMMDNCELDSEHFDRQIFKAEYLLLAVPRSMKINQELKDFQITVDAIRDLSFLNDAIPCVDLKLFSEEPFIVLKPENDTRIRAMKLFHQYGFTPNIIFELDQQMTAYNVTCSGMGISFISNTLISKVPAFSDVVYYKLSEEQSIRNLYFYWKKGRYFSKVMQKFLENASQNIY